ncbi:MAG: hypothetical protein COB67_04570 [SAR324 cluster bacterium]|uniref:Uncharacterized protein n=1 Tax=SAR324 cluster bacterium TaxID=2024889 RepID=A0A2A4T720_9DELT|nr:MAG: hypothetical protein COB67_04570 [SAR324 cluster bacterium]
MRVEGKRIKKRAKPGQMQAVAIMAVSLTSMPLIMIDENPIFSKGSLVIKVSSQGVPVKGAKITLISPEKEKTYWVSNAKGYALAKVAKDRTGNSEIELDSGSYRLEVEKETFGKRKIKVFVPESGFVEQIVKLNLLNKAPIANAGINAFIQPNTKITLDASKSRDPDMPAEDLQAYLTEQDFLDASGNPNGKRIETYRWQILSKPEYSNVELVDQNTVSPTLTPDKEGEYIVSVTVSDGIESNTDTVDIKVDFPYVRKANLPMAKGGHSSNIVQKYAYIIGGWNVDFLDSVDAYDLKRDSWTPKAPLKIARNHHRSFVYQDKIYVVGGHNKEFPDGIATVEVYDPQFDSWTKASAMPTPRFNFSGNMYNGKFYTFGGKGGVKKVEVYDPLTDTWEKKSDMPVGRFRHTGSLVADKFYLIGGRGTESLVQEYDPVTDIWTNKAPMPSPRYYTRSAVLYNKIYVIGGFSFIKGTGRREVEAYDPQKDSWKMGTPLPTPLDIHSMNVYNKRIYIFGGEEAFGQSSAMDTNQVYNPLFELQASGKVE